MVSLLWFLSGRRAEGYCLPIEFPDLLWIRFTLGKLLRFRMSSRSIVAWASSARRRTSASAREVGGKESRRTATGLDLGDDASASLGIAAMARPAVLRLQAPVRH
jgi:hypothetical protein